MTVLENEPFTVSNTVTNHPAGTVCVGGPAGNGDRVLDWFLSIFRGRMLGNDIVRQHTTRISHVKLTREVVIVWKLIETIAPLTPFVSYICWKTQVTREEVKQPFREGRCFLKHILPSFVVTSCPAVVHAEQVSCENSFRPNQVRLPIGQARSRSVPFSSCFRKTLVQLIMIWIVPFRFGYRLLVGRILG